ncbi:MAG: nitrous oxide-stimulated promoter family protein [Thermoplasmata archaeon]|nr:MAG: nitrous oxide-stimulated promoter family protein [Thermoplasmata archaeon]
MPDEHPRIARERKTIKIMIEMHCKAHHDVKKGLCSKCSELQDYAMKRLDKCKLHENKPTCAKCTVHCYKPAMRERVRAVMRYSGPRMLSRHPVLALLHLRDSRRKVEGGR